MKKLAALITRAANNFEKEILPKAKLASTTAKDGEYLQQRLAELRRIAAFTLSAAEKEEK